MKARKWLICWMMLVLLALIFLGKYVYDVDPYFHYHKPNLDKYFYILNNERSQNDGIVKHFEYDAMITGTSMTENFKVSEMNTLWGCNAVKTAFSGGSYKEINDNIVRALKANPNLKMVIRGLDMMAFLEKADAMRNDLGNYPTYLYDYNPFNDVKYLLNRDVIFGRCYQMQLDYNTTGKIGITSFDEYSRWWGFNFGINTVCPVGLSMNDDRSEKHLTDLEKNIIRNNIELNVTSVAKAYPDVDFYYFYTPYSAVWWCSIYNDGTIYRQLEAEKYITELVLQYPNIHLFSFNNRSDIITDLNNYKDWIHYGDWINSLILKWIHDGSYQLTLDNYEEYCEKEYELYTGIDYAGLSEQQDYESDLYAAAILNNELTGAEPKNVLRDYEISLRNSSYTDNDKRDVVSCIGTLDRDYQNSELSDYLKNEDYIGLEFYVDIDAGYKYIFFNGQKIKDHGCVAAYAYDFEGNVIDSICVSYSSLDNEIHQYVLDVSESSGIIQVILNGGYVDCTGDKNSEYQFSNVWVF